ncbi:MAG: ATP-NAD kinase family protein [Firmicutes bacterium]|nr:ATP-NAD kinase family protein [Bacillota bacterium]
MKKLGLIVNPWAGLGGRVGLKGSDGADTVDHALALGAVPEAPGRAVQALKALHDVKKEFEVYTYGGLMGEDELKEVGVKPIIIGDKDADRSTPEDTRRAAQIMRDQGVDLIVFAGGDGTARDICEAIGTDVPVIGIPAGVKIHSSVYALNPKNAGYVIRDFINGTLEGFNEAEVMDIDESLFRQGQVSARLYGYMMVPAAGEHVQHSKAGGQTERDALIDMACYVCDEMEDDTYYIIGPGSTTRAIMEELELPNTLLGVDIIKDEELVASDVIESEIWALIEDPDVKVKIIVTIIGGQGALFGRGNQQLSPRILRRVGKNNIIIVSSAKKMQALEGRPLTVDTGDPELDKELCGFKEVIIAYAQSTYSHISDE